MSGAFSALSLYYFSRLVDARRAKDEEAPTKLRVFTRSPFPGLPVKLQSGS